MIIRHDLHIHTPRSSCAPANGGGNIANYVELARKEGLNLIGISDHMWDSAVPGAKKWYIPQNYEHVSTVRAEIAETEHEGINILFGCECEYDRLGEGVAITEEVAEQLDFLIVPNSHTHITMPKDLYEPWQAHADYMLKAFYDIINSPVSKYITAIAHPFMAVACPYSADDLIRLITDDQFKACFTAAAEKGIAMELNLWYCRAWDAERIYNSRMMEMMRIAKDCGCKFTIGSDAHCKEEFKIHKNAYLPVTMLGLTEEDFHPITRASFANENLPFSGISE